MSDKKSNVVSLVKDDQPKGTIKDSLIYTASLVCKGGLLEDCSKILIIPLEDDGEIYAPYVMSFSLNPKETLALLVAAQTAQVNSMLSGDDYDE